MKEHREPGTMESLRHFKFSAEESRTFEDYIQPCLAEFVGTILYIAIACLSVLTNPSEAGFVQPALAHGMALGAFITTFGRLSGGHFNPAVSLAVFISGGLAPINLIVFVIFQMVGGILGALIAKSLKDSTGSENAPVCTVGQHSSVMTAFGVELMCSFILILIVLLTSVDDLSKSNIAPIAIAFFVTSAVLTSASLSGACFNPVRAFGPAVIWHEWEHHWIYWAGPMISAFSMALIYRYGKIANLMSDF